MGAVHHTIAPSMYPKLDYDLEKDFIPLDAGRQRAAGHRRQSAAGRRSTDLKGLLDLLRKQPGQATTTRSAGNGTSHHLAGELFKLQTKTFITHIPYRGAGPALQDLIAGQVDMMFDGLGSSATHIKGGRIKALDGRRAASATRLPRRAERRPKSGLPDYTVATWYGLWAPKGTPKDDRQSEMRGRDAQGVRQPTS